MAQRTLTESNTKLIGALVSVVGTVTITKYNDTLTYISPNQIQLKRYMLRPVWIAGIYYDHLWIHSCDEIDHFRNGDKVSFTAMMNTYRFNGETRIAIRFPYGNILPVKPISPQMYIPREYLLPKYVLPIEPRRVLKFYDLSPWDLYKSLRRTNQMINPIWI